MVSARVSRRAGARGARRYVDRLIGDMATIARHEAEVLHGHLSAMNVRVRVAQRARGVGELLRDQVDLLPESRNRLRRDQSVRRRLWRGLIDDLAEPVVNRGD